MKKQVYGIYVILFGLWIKYFKKNDTKAQMKFLAAATKWSSMVLIISFTLGCAMTQGNPLAPGGGAQKQEENIPEFIRGDWKAGLNIPSNESTLGEIDSGPIKLGKDNPTEEKAKPEEENKKEVVEEEISKIAVLIPNGDFEEPLLNCTGPCASKGFAEQVYTGTLIPAWTVNEGGAGIWRTNLKSPIEEQNQYLDLTGVIEQKLETKKDSEYLLSFLGGANTFCGDEAKNLKIFWDGEESASTDLKNEKRVTYEIPVISRGEESVLRLEGTSADSCGPTLDDIKLRYVKEVPALKVEEILETETPTLEGTPDPDVTPNPEVTPDPNIISNPEVPTAVPSSAEEISVMPTPTPTPIPEPTFTPVPTATPVPTPIPTPEPTVPPTIVPTPSPTPSKYDIPGQATAITAGNIIDFSQPPKLTGDIISFKGKVLTKEEPLVVQVWNTQSTLEARESDAKYDPNVCSTEQPSIFFRKPLDLGYAYIEHSVLINWTYCLNTFDIPSDNTVPWEVPDKWTFNVHSGELIFEGNKLGGINNEYEVVSRYILVIIGPQGVMTRRKIN